MRVRVPRWAVGHRDPSARLVVTRAAAAWSVVVLAVAVLLPAPARAARPLDTEDTGTVDPGRAELELSADFARGSGDDTWAAKGVLSTGVWPRVEVRVESALLLLDPRGEPGRAGIGDSLLGIKYRVLDESPVRPAVLTGVALRLPTGDESRGLGAEGVDVTTLAAVSKTLGALVFTGNLGYTFVTADRPLDLWTLAASLEYRARKSVWLVGEAVGTLGVDAAGDRLVLRAGAVWAVTDRVKLDGAVGAGATRASPDVTITLGLTLRLY